jgi:hypothetical protein
MKGLEKDQADWEGAPAEDMSLPIDLLKPKSELHEKVLHYLVDRIELSERHMSNFYSRWNVMEEKMQAYVNLPDWDAACKRMKEEKKLPKPAPIVIPYMFATVSTITTYLLHVFTGRKPLFQVGTYKAETGESSRFMELVLQYNADHVRLVRHMAEFLQATQMYGLGVLRVNWEVKTRPRTVWKVTDDGRRYSIRKDRVVYEGNSVFAQDPYLFFPDPSVPMVDVNKQGEFVFWRTFEGLHQLKKMEADGVWKYVDEGQDDLPKNNSNELNSRAMLSHGYGSPGVQPDSVTTRMRRIRQIDQGTVEIIPKELGLGDSERPEKWLFTIKNKSQILQAEPLGADHGMHPVAVAEPYSLGRAFGAPGITDYLGPIQDMVSWLINARQDNVRQVLNNMFVVDPNMVNLPDLKNPEPGKLIRLKNSALGRDVRSAIFQLAVQDVTSGHTQDADRFMRLGQQLSAVTENILGMQDSGGRKTASEVRITSEAAASRLAAQARLISAQGLVDLTEMMSTNIQQYISEEFYIQVVGEQGREQSIRVAPEQLVGDFFYPVHDGTLPLDRVALFEVWQGLFGTVLGDPQIRQGYDIMRMLEFIAELGGARNISTMRLDVQSPDQIAQGVQSGNLVPMEQFAGEAQGPGQMPTSGPDLAALLG